jgi:hypothetical protein
MQGFHSYKGRSITDGQRIKVYFNLHNKKYSAVAMDGLEKGRVLGHFDEVVLNDVSFIVSEAGRQRVLREKKKNVHAYAVGRLCKTHQMLISRSRIVGSKLRYNPYKMRQFHVDETPVTQAGGVYLGHRGLYAVDAR